MFSNFNKKIKHICLILLVWCRRREKSRARPVGDGANAIFCEKGRIWTKVKRRPISNRGVRANIVCGANPRVRVTLGFCIKKNKHFCLILLVWCRRRDSNPHEVALGGFWVRSVYHSSTSAFSLYICKKEYIII